MNTKGQPPLEQLRMTLNSYMRSEHIPDPNTSRSESVTFPPAKASATPNAILRLQSPSTTELDSTFVHDNKRAREAGREKNTNMGDQQDTRTLAECDMLTADTRDNARPRQRTATNGYRTDSATTVDETAAR